MKFVQDDTLGKLKLLFILEKMEIPLTENSIIDITTGNKWLNYMDCIDILSQLMQMNFVYKIENETNTDDLRYAITYGGRECLSHFYQRIPQSLREDITHFAKENRMNFKRSQEYISEYTKNVDGSYKVTLKIKEPLVNMTLLEVSIKAPNKSTAISACNKWNEKAPNIFEFLYDNILDN